MTHRGRPMWGPALLASSFLSLAAVPTPAADVVGTERVRVFVGTYTNGKSLGIYCFEMQAATGKPNAPRLVGKAKNPSFLALHPNRKYLYAVSEVPTVDGKRTGAVLAFAINPATGDLAEINHQESGGGGPCHVVVDPSGKVVLVANYGGGSVASLPIRDDGGLDPAASVIQHQGSSVNQARQERPHAHSINTDAAGRFAFAADLGTDKVYIYRLDAATAKLTPNEPAFASVDPGSGPRHFAFHPNGKVAYVINELLNTITVMNYDAEKGSLTPVQTITTLPSDFSGRSHTAEVVVHPSGKFVYGSNRGHDSIAVFAVDETTGKLQTVEVKQGDIAEPRNFSVDPSGRFLLVGNQRSDSIVIFRIDLTTGALRPTGHKVLVGAPVCLRMLRISSGG